MQVLISSLWGGLLTILSSVVGRILLALGMGAVTYLGFGSVLDDLTSMGTISLQGLPDELKKILGLLRIGEVFSLYVSTVSIKLLYQGITKGGSVTQIRSLPKG